MIADERLYTTMRLGDNTIQYAPWTAPPELVQLESNTHTCRYNQMQPQSTARILADAAS